MVSPIKPPSYKSFSMYRLKSQKRDADGAEKWVPILLKPEIVQEYSEPVVDTLHQKNLLLLGEDRFLSTIMLRNFPHRKMMFCPQAVCKTIVPSTMGVLLSQRRRWINSTLHNLMELVRVRNLCGTFCFSMQFVALTDLIGTVVLPAAISLTVVLIVKAILSPPKDFADAIPLLMLALLLGLPALLILITTRKLVYVFWMVIYVLALPIWNFLLPLYALLKMDDFSWGDTRKVVGDGKKGHGHGEIMDVVAESLASTVPLKRWEDWQKLSRHRLKRETARVRQLAISAPSHYGSTFYPASDDGTLLTNGPPRISPAVPSVPDRYRYGTPVRRSHLSGVVFPPPPNHPPALENRNYSAPLDEDAYNPRGTEIHPVLLPPLPGNMYTNLAGYLTPNPRKFPFHTRVSYSPCGNANPLGNADAPAGINDGPQRPSIIPRDIELNKKGWFKWGHKESKSSRGTKPPPRLDTSWFDYDD